MLRASFAAERAGIPSATIVSSQFMRLGKHVSKGLGMEALPMAEYQGVPMTDGIEQLKRKVAATMVDQIVSGLTSQPLQGQGDIEPAPDEIVFGGDLVGVQDYFYDRLWTDGLPIIPPTRATVAHMLRFTTRAASDVVGVLPPDNRQATVWSIAVNGVMAGCRPEYMPLLIATVEAIAAPEFRLRSAGSTPGWEPLVIVNGPIAKQLDFNAGTGAMRSGRRANSTVGRFLKLYMRNVAGLRTPPGEGDKGIIGSNFNVALAEDEDSIAQLGWNTFSTDRGFAIKESVVTVQGVLFTSPPIYSSGDTAELHLQMLLEVFGQACTYRAHVGLINKAYEPLLILGPSVARVLAKDGLSKNDLRHFLFKHATMPAHTMERYALAGGHTRFSLRELARKGDIPMAYYESDDPDRLVPVFVAPEMIGVVVAGDSGRNQSKGYVINHVHGRPVSKRIVS